MPTRIGTEKKQWRCVDGRSGTGDFSLRLFLVASSCPVQYVRYKLQPCFPLTAHIIIFSDTKAALFFILARGLRFCLSPKEVDKYDVKCSFKLLHRGLIKLDENHDQLKRNRTKPKSIRKNTL